MGLAIVKRVPQEAMVCVFLIRIKPNNLRIVNGVMKRIGDRYQFNRILYQILTKFRLNPIDRTV